MAPIPIKFHELVQLANVGVDTQSIGFNSCVSLTCLSCASTARSVPVAR